MKYLNMIGTLLLMGATHNVAASCISTGYNTLGSAADISGKQILAVGGGDDWKEDHCASGDLYKIGAGTTVDPYAFRGTWSISGNNVQYNYTISGTSSYNWELYKNTTSGALCWQDATGVIIATAPAPGSAGACGSMLP